MERRRLEEILDPTYLEGIDQWPTARLRDERAACEAEEEAVSYARRVLQGRLDILRADLLRRQHEGASGAGDVLAMLPAILSEAGGAADAGRSPGSPRATRLRVPPRAEEYEARIDALTGDVDADVEERELDELEELVSRLATLERELSGIRRSLFERLDALRSELAARYKDGRASVSDLLAGPSS